MDFKTILTILTGSRAYGYARPDSDYDYRSVVVAPTSLVLDPFRQREMRTVQKPGDEDSTQYEIGHFVHLMSSGNPTIIECLYAPVVSSTSEGDELRRRLRDLIPYPTCVRSFLGYAEGARHKITEDPKRMHKHATSYLRLAYQLSDLLVEGGLRFPLGGLALKDCIALRAGEMSIDDAITQARLVLVEARQQAKYEVGQALLDQWLNGTPVSQLVDKQWETEQRVLLQHHLTEFLLDIRKANW